MFKNGDKVRFKGTTDPEMEMEVVYQSLEDYTLVKGKILSHGTHSFLTKYLEKVPEPDLIVDLKQGDRLYFKGYSNPFEVISAGPRNLTQEKTILRIERSVQITEVIFERKG